MEVVLAPLPSLPPPSPAIIFEGRNLPQQTIYCWKRNLSESPIHFRCRQNILISRLYEQFSRNCRNLGHFLKFEKISNSWNLDMLYSSWSTWSGESEYIVCLAKYLNIAKIWVIIDLVKFIKVFLKSRNLNISMILLFSMRLNPHDNYVFF